MSPSSLNSIPMTPFPDPPGNEDEQREAAPDQTASPAPAPKIAKPSTASADDLSLLLAQSAPDPYLSEAEVPPGGTEPAEPRADLDGGDSASFLGSLCSSENEIDITISPPPAEQRGFPVAPLPSTPQPESYVLDQDHGPRIHWPLLLVSSYASALTLALGLILWTGRGLWQTDHRASEEPAPAANGEPSSRGPTSYDKFLIPLPDQNATVLRKPLRLSRLEVTAHSVVRRPVKLLRLEGTADEERESPPVLVLTLGLTNRSSRNTFAPLDPSMVRDPVPAVDQSYIELPGGRRISMFRLAVESEWSIHDQVFPSLKPGETAETILVSEPVTMSELTTTMTWHVKLRTAPYRTEVLGVRFTPRDVENESF